MKKTLCYSVRLQSLVSISDKAYVATGFDGSEAVLPKSQVFGRDWDVMKSDAYWIAAWILAKKDLQYSGKKSAWFDRQTGRQLPKIRVRKHVPEKKNKSAVSHDDSLLR